MREEIKQSLIKETERHIAQDILYDDVYVGPFTEKDGVDCAVHAVDWYRNNIWRDTKEKPVFPRNGNALRLVAYRGYNMWVVVAPSLESWEKICLYDEIVRWAYLEDFLPDNSIKQATTYDIERNARFVKYEIPCHIAVVNGTVYFSKDPFKFEGVQSQPIDKACEIDFKRRRNEQSKEI